MKTRSILAAALIASASLVGAVGYSAGAATKTPARYTLTNVHAKCRAGYRRENTWPHGKKKPLRVVCNLVVKDKVVAPTTTTQPATGSPRATLDPSFTQNPSNGLDVTFSYSASDAGVSGELPDGVLELFYGPSADEVLGCSIDVGGDVTGGTCEVIFPSYGEWAVTVDYVSGTSSATETTTEDITNPSPPTTTSVPVTTTTLIGNTGPSGNTGVTTTTAVPVTTTVPPTTTTTVPPLPTPDISAQIEDIGDPDESIVVTVSGNAGAVTGGSICLQYPVARADCVSSNGFVDGSATFYVHGIFGTLTPDWSTIDATYSGDSVYGSAETTV